MCCLELFTGDIFLFLHLTYTCVSFCLSYCVELCFIQHKVLRSSLSLKVLGRSSPGCIVCYGFIICVVTVPIIGRGAFNSVGLCRNKVPGEKRGSDTAHIMPVTALEFQSSKKKIIISVSQSQKNNLFCQTKPKDLKFLVALNRRKAANPPISEAGSRPQPCG